MGGAARDARTDRQRMRDEWHMGDGWGLLVPGRVGA